MPFPFKLKHGDKVTFIDARGARRTGKVNGLLIFPTHVVLDMGGKYGTPAVVTPVQIVNVKEAA